MITDDDTQRFRSKALSELLKLSLVFNPTYMREVVEKIGMIWPEKQKREAIWPAKYGNRKETQNQGNI